MSKGGAERQFEHMRAAMEALRNVVDVIDREEVGATVSMPINKAALAFGIPGETFRRMGERRQELGISVIDERVEVKLYGGERERRKTYRFLYSLIQSLPQGKAPEFLATRKVSESLLEEFPRLKDIFELAEEGLALPEEELISLQIHLEALWEGIRDRTDLQDPMNALTSVAY